VGFPANKTRNLSLKAWDSLCLPKDLGGLGLRKIREVNLALISKLGWKLLNNSKSLWVSQLHCKYLISCSLLSPCPFFSLMAMKRHLKIILFISKGACNQIHSFSSLPIWSSTWIPNLSSFTPSPSSPWLSQPFPNLMVSALFFFDPILSVPTWNIQLLHYLFDEETIRGILKTNFSSYSESKYIWTPSANGLFSTKSAHKMISSQRSIQTQSTLPGFQQPNGNNFGSLI
jgi:hypothetical protein